MVASQRTHQILWIAVVVAGVLTVAGMIALWPRGTLSTVEGTESLFGDPIAAVVTGASVGPCSFDDASQCETVTVRPQQAGAAAGTWEQGVPSLNGVDVGDEIYVYATDLGGGVISYSFADFQRERTLLYLLVAFVAACVLLAGRKGVTALVGLAASLLILVSFVLPSLLRGNDAVLVALVGASAVAFIALYLAHGVNLTTSVALLSSFLALIVTGALSWLFVRVAKFTGFNEDSSFVLNTLGVQIDARGLLLAGIVIGSLGVLDDVTVTQVSAVGELRRARPEAPTRELYASAMRIGRDHITSTVNTLFLTYAGAALPLLLIFSISGQGVMSAINSESIATEIVRSLCGSIGLIASVPRRSGHIIAVAGQPSRVRWARRPQRRSTRLNR
jgi:uncharacterized membrane protein